MFALKCVTKSSKKKLNTNAHPYPILADLYMQK